MDSDESLINAASNAIAHLCGPSAAPPVTRSFEACLPSPPCPPLAAPPRPTPATVAKTLIPEHLRPQVAPGLRIALQETDAAAGGLGWRAAPPQLPQPAEAGNDPSRIAGRPRRQPAAPLRRRRVWRGALLMAQLLCADCGAAGRALSGRTVLELGAGCGLCGILAARLGAAQARRPAARAFAGRRSLGPVL